MFPDEDDAKTIAFLNQLRTGDTIDQLIIIRKLSKQSSLAVIHGLIDVLCQGNKSIIEAVAKALGRNGRENLSDSENRNL